MGGLGIGQGAWNHAPYGGMFGLGIGEGACKHAAYGGMFGLGIGQGACKHAPYGGMGGRVRFYRTFSVASPTIANIKLMIQKRMTIWGSAQPRFSKWWWMGAMRKMRFLVRL